MQELAAPEGAMADISNSYQRLQPAGDSIVLLPDHVFHTVRTHSQEL